MNIERIFRDLKLKSFSNSHLPNSASVFLTIISSKMVKDKMNILEIGSGIGHVSLVLSKVFEKSNFYGVEIQKDLYDFSLENKKVNNSPNIEFINDDIKNISNYFDNEFFDLIISNPPHYISGKSSNLTDRKIARTFDEKNIFNFIDNSWKMIKNKKSVIYVLHSNSFRSFFYNAIDRRLEPYEIIPAYGKNSKESQLICLKLRKNGGKNLTFKKPYII
ncbi:MAG: methyltransferase domain-containing protein [Thermotogota bacterium]